MNNKMIIGVIVLALVILGGFYFLSSGGSVTSEPTTKEFSLKIIDKKIVEGQSTITVKQGDTVVIKITSDEAEEFHVHGYDSSVDLEPNEEATLTFVANASGHFEFELEESKTDIGAIEVQP